MAQNSINNVGKLFRRRALEAFTQAENWRKEAPHMARLRYNDGVQLMHYALMIEKLPLDVAV